MIVHLIAANSCIQLRQAGLMLPPACKQASIARLKASCCLNDTGLGYHTPFSSNLCVPAVSNHGCSHTLGVHHAMQHVALVNTEQRLQSKFAKANLAARPTYQLLLHASQSSKCRPAALFGQSNCSAYSLMGGVAEVPSAVQQQMCQLLCHQPELHCTPHGPCKACKVCLCQRSVLLKLAQIWHFAHMLLVCI